MHTTILVPYHHTFDGLIHILLGSFSHCLARYYHPQLLLFIRMRVSLLPSKALSYRLATLFPTLFALTSTVRGVQCFASLAAPSFTYRQASTPFALKTRGGAAFTTASSSSSPTSTLHKHRPLFGTTTSTTTTSSSTDNPSSTSNTMTPAAKIQALRTRMKELEIDVYLVPSDDPHLSGECRGMNATSTT